MREEAKKLYVEHLEGNALAFAGLVRLLTPRFFRTFIHLGAGPFDAEDLCQEFFAAIYRAGAGYDRERDFMPWAYEIARNIYFKSAARESRVKIIPLESWVAAKADGREDEIFVSELLAKLSEEKRSVFEMKHFGGLRFDEIAAILKIPAGTAKSRMFAAVTELKEILSGSGI